MHTVRLSTFFTAVALCLGGFSTAAISGSSDDLGERSRLASGLVSKWAGHVQETYGIDSDTWARRMVGTFEAASLSDLEQASRKDSFDAMSSALLGASGNVSPLAFGDPDGDLVYTPIVPCRIIDTRIVGGAIPGGTERNFVAATNTNFLDQGGTAGNCGIPLDVSAVTINIAAARPPAEGFFTAYPANASRPLAASLVYQGDNRNAISGSVLSLCSGGNCQPDFTVYASTLSELVIDITGYFIPAEATALDCVTEIQTGNLDLLGGLQTREVACPSGYVATGGGCGGVLGVGVGHSRPQVVGGENVGWSCGLFGSLISILGYEASAACCRTPGR